MTDPLTWSPINLGRWGGTQVRVHFFLIFFVVVELLYAALAKETPGTAVAKTACWLALLLLALAVHELGHAAMAAWLGAERDEVRLWPLGNMVSPSVATRSPESALVAIGGPVANSLVTVSTAIGLNFANARFVWNPFNHGDSGAPFVGNGQAPFQSPVWFVGWFGFLNYVLMLANLIPALPFDMGLVVRSYLANSPVPQSKDNLLGAWTARSCAAVLVVVGVIRLVAYKDSGSVGFTLIGLAVLIELMVRSEARMLEDGGFYEDGVFGYDFSEGYTSLEGSAAKVRPYRESALKRWRRRRSDQRRQRRQARQAAEERRMDEILEKLYREGRSALSDEEHRFLVRVSAKYRNRPKARE
jgi:hypothetical protein